MTESFIYSDILQSIGWFNAGNPYKKLGDVNYVHYINGKVNIDKDTIIAYFPGCFAQFHDGHITVINEMKLILSSVSDNYVIVLAPAKTACQCMCHYAVRPTYFRPALHYVFW